MSAFLVDRIHIDLLVKLACEGPRGIAVCPMNAWHPGYYLREPGGGAMTPDRLGALLWTENLRSVSARYPNDGDGGRPGPCGLTDAEIADYTYTDPHYRMTIAEALQAIACYEYQSCEHDDWSTSHAHAVCECIRHRLCQLLPGIDAAPWEWTAERLAERRAAQYGRPTTRPRLVLR